MGAAAGRLADQFRAAQGLERVAEVFAAGERRSTRRMPKLSIRPIWRIFSRLTSWSADSSR
jgi:hypothetical protein